MTTDELKQILEEFPTSVPVFIEIPRMNVAAGEYEVEEVFVNSEGEEDERMMIVIKG